jgi:hypothetical protein
VLIEPCTTRKVGRIIAVLREAIPSGKCLWIMDYGLWGFLRIIMHSTGVPLPKRPQCDWEHCGLGRDDLLRWQALLSSCHTRKRSCRWECCVMNKQRYRDAKYSKAGNSTSRLYLGIHHYWDRRHFQGRQQRLLRQAKENIPSKGLETQRTSLRSGLTQWSNAGSYQSATLLQGLLACSLSLQPWRIGRLVYMFRHRGTGE